MNHSIRIHQTGGPEVLRWEEHDPGKPEPGQVLLRHNALGVNFIDTYQRSGLYPLTLPSGLGLEGAGLVEALGPGVTAFKVGDRVAYAGGPVGAYAESRIFPAAKLVALPADIEEKTAAAIMLKGMTVEYLIRRTFRVEKGMTVLFHAAAGGVGLIACQWLKALGAIVIGTVGSEEKAALAKAHGCDHVILYKKEDFVAKVHDLTKGRGVPVVYDSVGKTTLLGSLDCLARRGMLVTFGNASGKPDPLDLLLLSQKGSLSVCRPTLADYTASHEDLLASSSALFDVIRRGAVKIRIGQTFPLKDAAQAHRALESRQTTGSTILIP